MVGDGEAQKASDFLWQRLGEVVVCKLMSWIGGSKARKLIKIFRIDVKPHLSQHYVSCFKMPMNKPSNGKNI